MSYDYDLFVIGAGSGGIRSARLAAQLGKKVAIAEEYRLGGTCVIKGCIPKKILFYASQYSEHLQDCLGFGWRVGQYDFDWKALISAKDNEISRLENLYRDILSRVGVDILQARASLVDSHTIHLENMNRAVTARHIVIASGSSPNRMEAMPGHEFCITSDEIFFLEKLPESILILGSGYIAVEFANILHGFGVKTILLHRGKEVLSQFDSDIRQGLTRAMIDKGISIISEDHIKAIFQKGMCLEAETKSGKSILVDQVLLATGRKPNTGNMGLERAGVEIDSRNAICTNEYFQTNIQSIFAIGDVINRVQLTPVAIHEAMCFVETVFKNNPVFPDYDCIPTAVFSQPEVACVGLTEEAAMATFPSLEIYKAQFKPMKSTLSMRSDYTIMKLIVNSVDRKVLGVHILGHVASEMIQVIGVCVKAGCSKDDFDRCIAVHPTAAEELVTIYSPSYYIKDGCKVSYQS
ncbi:Glutathione reductase [Liberibacter crescens BT-1]|uniref:Glutathione reductase n=1 Tax=Liberibacter crescens (strain BT-1) TaxID=1215343 RepID=L0ET67_LIBCB|nr:glutathione-disulfide reductase [Liberibacter crescens]AGA64729.1 Glutathione reductase [Liberibacter crescens BT-1]AMC12814.1 glutathione reductase [Liberibacter crescens]